MKQWVLLVVSALLPLLLKAQNLELSVYFTSNSFELSANEQQAIDSLLATLDEGVVYTMQIAGHTDLSGSMAYNATLSKQRAEAVDAYIKSKYLPITTTLSWYGESKPIGGFMKSRVDDTDRRVEMTISEIFRPAASGSGIDRIIPALQDLVGEPTICQISTQQANTVDCLKGSKLYFPANCFEDKHGNTIEGNVQIEVHEFYDMDEILAAQLSTATHSNQILETAGMLHVSATQDGEELFLADGEEMKVSFAGNIPPGMQLFNGSVDEEGNLDWTLSPEEDSDTEEKPLIVSIDNIESTKGADEVIAYDKQNGKYTGLRCMWQGDSLVVIQEAQLNTTGISYILSEDNVLYSFNMGDPNFDPNKQSAYVSMNDFTSAGLGWINCDKFNFSPGAKQIEVIADIDGPAELEYPKTYLIFHHVSSVLPMSTIGSQAYTKMKMPKNKDASIVSVGVMGDEIYVGIQQFKTGKPVNSPVQMHPIQKEALADLLASLN